MADREEHLRIVSNALLSGFLHPGLMLARTNPSCNGSLKTDIILYGGDYNPDQWLHMPEIITEDFRLMKLANCNTATLGVFSWTALEPEEGKYCFGWLDDMMDRLADHGMNVILSTPSGAKPAWMAQRYPEVLRVDSERNVHKWGGRHNHCFTSPVYREKTRLINTALAERYKNHPALILWHVSNEYGGECLCERCQEAFRIWLKVRYHNDLDLLNKAWYAAFWSHQYTAWEQINPPMKAAEQNVHGQNLDWKRFVTHQTVDFMKCEIAPLKNAAPGIPVTTNMMGIWIGLDYYKFAESLDVISWDCYPAWHSGYKGEDDHEIAAYQGFLCDFHRSLKHGKPFLLMEMSPSSANWQPVNALPRPGMSRLTALMNVAHGSESVLYFQWRQSRGGCEQFHGAVVSHAGHENTRVFREVARTGADLQKLQGIMGSTVPAEVAIIYDFENRWILDDIKGYRHDGLRNYNDDVLAHYTPFWRLGVNTDVIDSEQDFSTYRLIVAPMLYMIKPGVAERLETFVEKGGTLVTTYLTGIADESNLAFFGGWPGPLRKLLGLWCEETDALPPDKTNGMIFQEGNSLGLTGQYPARIFCDLIHSETAEVLAIYGSDFYEGTPCVTVNMCGKGRAYHLATKGDGDFLLEFYTRIVRQSGVKRVLDIPLPAGVSVVSRKKESEAFIFVLNFNAGPATVDLGGARYTDILTQEICSGPTLLSPYGVRVLAA